MNVCFLLKVNVFAIFIFEFCIRRPHGLHFKSRIEPRLAKLFTNVLPNYKSMSGDRWATWTVDDLVTSCGNTIF